MSRVAPEPRFFRHGAALAIVSACFARLALAADATNVTSVVAAAVKDNKLPFRPETQPSAIPQRAFRRHCASNTPWATKSSIAK